MAGTALARAVDAITTGAAPLAPFVMVQAGGAVSVTGQASAAAAREYAVARTEAELAAFAADAVIPFDGRSQAAVVVEAWNFSSRRGAAIALRYGMKRGRAFPIGGPLELGTDGWIDRLD